LSERSEKHGKRISPLARVGKRFSALRKSLTILSYRLKSLTLR
jgi:hypothetical protein